MSISLIYFTAPSKEEALRMARTAVQERLAACANVFHPATSIYEWEGKLEETQEALCLLKTAPGRVQQLVARLVEMHPYQCPCVVAYKSDDVGHEPFLRWVVDQTAPPVLEANPPVDPGDAADPQRRI